MIENFLILARALAGAAQPEICQTTHINRIESSEEGPAEECGTWNCEVVRSGGLCHLERLRGVTLVKRFNRAEGREVTEQDRCILGVAFFKIRLDLPCLRGVLQKRQRKSRSVVGVQCSLTTSTIRSCLTIQETLGERFPERPLRTKVRTKGSSDRQDFLARERRDPPPALGAGVKGRWVPRRTLAPTSSAVSTKWVSGGPDAISWFSI